MSSEVGKAAHIVAAASWRPEGLAASPAHAPFAQWSCRLPQGHFPACADLNALLDSRHCSGSGGPLCFVSSDACSEADMRGRGREAYEARIFRCGEIVTREDNWHDLFNALAWLTFPRTKRELNRAHHEHMQGSSSKQRGTARDALTLFDESGVLVACADPSLAQLLTGFRWKELFLERRDDVENRMRFFVFGHALHEKALAPHAGMTGRALILECSRPFMDAPMTQQLAELDERAAAWLRDPTALASTRLLAPLPLLGIPGWDPGNNEAAYYDNTGVFRPGRRGCHGRTPGTE